ncbi:uncharacterized protein DUF2784 [Micromonospora pisi]|uniref:Uncharacterized protein DUF2784 n=1 Tax=Micromonospora pisi TaxID=589240 RepID=A0A495JPB5_9ACTN|nr:DUF2784 domain-containing protein [Micromonospora pisi]RKR90840.1 uncharacterized protein DUF2784 [Micromonospora pisi]
MGYRLLTTVILVVHFGFLAYLLLGGFVAWRWRWTIWPHLAAAGWGMTVVVGKVVCPLTHAEHWSRRRAGETGAATTQGFIDRYVEGVIYPEQFTALAQLLLALTVAASWAGFLRPLLRPSPEHPPRRRL